LVGLVAAVVVVVAAVVVVVVDGARNIYFSLEIEERMKKRNYLSNNLIMFGSSLLCTKQFQFA